MEKGDRGKGKGQAGSWTVRERAEQIGWGWGGEKRRKGRGLTHRFQAFSLENRAMFCCSQSSLGSLLRQVG